MTDDRYDRYDRYDRIVNLLGGLAIAGFGLAWTCLALAVVIQAVG